MRRAPVLQSQLRTLRALAIEESIGELVTPDETIVNDVLDDPRFQARLETGKIDLTRLTDAIRGARFLAWRDVVDGEGRDNNRNRLAAGRRARPQEYRRVQRLFAALLELMGDHRDATLRSRGIKNPADWRFTGDALRRCGLPARTLVEALAASYPALALLYPELPGAPLIRRSSRNTFAAVQREARAMFRAAGLPNDLAGRLLAGVGLRRLRSDRGGDSHKARNTPL
jgi:hypothetical protein